MPSPIPIKPQILFRGQAVNNMRFIWPIDSSLVYGQVSKYLFQGSFFDDACPIPKYKNFYFEVVIDSTNNQIDIEEKDITRYGIYPNPADKFISIDGISEITDVRILDMTGRLIRNARTDDNGQVDIALLKKGLYLVEVESTMIKLKVN